MISNSPKPPSANLKDLQRWLRWIITDPRGAVDALENPHPEGKSQRYHAPEIDVRHLIQKSAHLETHNRLSVYAEAYFSRILEALESDFVSIRRLIGEDEFANLINGFLKDYPSKYTNITEIGRHLSLYLMENPQSYPAWLADLARLEWGLIESFYAGTCPPFNPATLHGRADSDWESARVFFDPGVRIHKSEWPLDQIHKALHLTKWQPKVTPLLIYRRFGFSQFAAVSAQEYLCLDVLLAGHPIGDAVEAALENNSDNSGNAAPTQSTTNINDWFTNWTSLGLISKIEF